MVWQSAFCSHPLSRLSKRVGDDEDIISAIACTTDLMCPCRRGLSPHYATQHRRRIWGGPIVGASEVEWIDLAEISIGRSGSIKAKPPPLALDVRLRYAVLSSPPRLYRAEVVSGVGEVDQSCFWSCQGSFQYHPSCQPRAEVSSPR